MTDKKTSQKRKSTLDLSTMVYGKIPPQAKDLEEAILGIILMHGNDTFEIAIEILRPEAFYVEAHQSAYRAMMHLYQWNQPINILTVIAELKKREELDMVGGPFFVTTLTNKVVSTSGLQHYCRIVIQKFLQREMIRVCGETIGDAYEDSTDAFDLIDSHAHTVELLQETTIAETYTGFDTEAVKAMERMHEKINAEGDLTGIDTGFEDLNHETCGWQPTDLIILAARPSVGKTAFAMNLADKSARSGCAVFLSSLEMSKQQIIDRWISYSTQIPLASILRPKNLDQTQLRLIEMKLAELSKLKIIIDDTGAMDVQQWQRKCRRIWKKNKNKKILFICDYIQLFTVNADSRLSREQQIAYISRKMKETAKELLSPVIALSQLSRDIEKRTGTRARPVLADLRESGAIEQDADLVGFLHAPEGIREPYRELIIAKNRMGSLSDIKLRADLTTQTFTTGDWSTTSKPFTADVIDPSSPTGKLEF